MSLVLSNDDGVNAEGLATLHSVLGSHSECLIVAPSGPQSGVGHAVTTTEPMRLEQIEPGRFGLAGTPADCVRVALGRSGAFARREFSAGAARSRASSSPGNSRGTFPGASAGQSVGESAIWLIAGINHGANLGMDTYISGTAAAAREAAILGFPAIAISQYVGRHRTPNWSATAERARLALYALLDRPPRPGTFWNVNLPHPADESVRHDLVYCPLDPSPHAFEYENRGGNLHWVSDFHARPRRAGHDVDVCMGGQISITEIPIGLTVGDALASSR